MSDDHAARRSLFTSPVLVCAAVALAVRLAVLAQGWDANPLIRQPALDGHVYLVWAHEIAAGDLYGTAKDGFVGGRPFFFNPLYAYLMAPFLAGLEAVQDTGWRLLDSVAPRLLAILVAQAALGAGTAALAAGAAGRFFGRAAAWVAGLATALSAVLVQLDTHVAVSGLGAFLVAGTVYSCAPDREGETRRHWALGARGPLAAGLWLGLGALARPVSVLAAPLVAWLFRKRSPAGVKAATVVLAVFAACAVPSFVRNWAASGVPAIYTAVGGLNLHLGNNPTAWKYRAMATSDFAFGPTDMHDSARSHVAEALRRVPDWGKVDGYFKGRTWDEFVDHPGPSTRHYVNKARWFFSPAEVRSSAGLGNDRSFAWLLHVAFVPTWLLAALGLVGAVLHRRRLEVLLGPGALVAAHWAVLTLVFPLSHYRSPAVPALAVLASGALAWVHAAWKEGRTRPAAGALGAVAAVALIGWAPPAPGPQDSSEAMTLARCYMGNGQAAPGSEAERWYVEAEGWCREAVEAYDRHWGEGFPVGWTMLGDLALLRGRPDEAVERLRTGLVRTPKYLDLRVLLSCALQATGDLQGAIGEAQTAVRQFPGAPSAHKRLAEALYAAGITAEAEPHARMAAQGGMPPNPAGCRPR